MRDDGVWSGRRLGLGYRVLGVVPLVIFLVHFWRNWGLGNPGHGLWMCHVSNLMLGFGLLLSQPVLVRVAVIWSIPGIPLWIMDMMRTGEMPVITFFSHLGGPIIGLAGLAQVRADRYMWVYGTGWYLFIQQICRMVTAPELNVNVAHTMYEGWERLFGAYWQYWIFTTVSAALTLWVVNLVLMRVFPTRAVPAAEREKDSTEEAR